MWEIDVPPKARDFFDLFLHMICTYRNIHTRFVVIIFIPLKVQEIAEHDGDDIHKSFEHDDLQLGFQFLADMINRLFFLLIVLAEIIAFSATIFVTLGSSHSDDVRLETVQQLEANS